MILLYAKSLEAIRVLFSHGWQFLVKLEVPGIGYSLASWLVAFFLAGLGLRLLSYIFSFRVHGDTPRTGSTRKPRISKERQGDTH